jgi:hypothetical protein
MLATVRSDLRRIANEEARRAIADVIEPQLRQIFEKLNAPA